MPNELPFDDWFDLVEQQLSHLGYTQPLGPQGRDFFYDIWETDQLSPLETARAYLANLSHPPRPE